MKLLFLFLILWISIGYTNAREYSAKIDSAHRYITKGYYSRALTEYIKAFSDTTFRHPVHLYEAASVAAIENNTDLCFMFNFKGWAD